MSTENRTALDAFTENVALIDEEISRLRLLSDKYFNKSLSNINWADVGDVAHYAEKLKEISNHE